ncbi:hypothetical protein NDK43_24500 [Neobacillus pocheonensis]|uniref:Amino acid permease n=1 Tax=Neobacillus pocheonensis TaxID=363869 RepID=A0ABT0WHF2_9BACI|nr:hypothetical protein [Neobacillus pocheonensis]
MGGIVTSVVAVIFAVTKFTSGAWIVLIVIPLFIFFSLTIHHHYQAVASELKIDLKSFRPETNRVVTIVLVSGVHRVVQNTLSFAISLCQANLLAVYVGFDDDSMKKMEAKWEEWGNPCRLLTLKSKYRSVLEPLSRLIKIIEEKEQFKAQIHIVIPQFVTNKWWHNLLHNQTALLLRLWLIRHKDVVITTVPYHLKK